MSENKGLLGTILDGLQSGNIVQTAIFEIFHNAYGQRYFSRTYCENGPQYDR